MAYTTILISASNEQTLPGLIACAEAIAVPNRSLITGLAVVPAPVLLPAGMPGRPASIPIDGHRKAAQAEAERMRLLFERALVGKPLTRAWRLVDAAPHGMCDAILALGRLADVIVASDVEPVQNAVTAYHMAECLIVEAGRPILLVPRRATYSTCGRRVLVAWNGSREATRAVFDALPVLKEALYVKVLWVGVDEPAPGKDQMGLALCKTLARHGVRATAEDLTLPGASAGAALLSALKAENADLLVMGGYGHRRFRELVLGGATRHVLRNMTVPVLMSH